MSVGIEAIEFYAPKTFVDQTDLGTFELIQNATTVSVRESTPKDWDNFNSPLPLRPKTSIPSLSQVR
jgi:hypothetical protein